MRESCIPPVCKGGSLSRGGKEVEGGYAGGWATEDKMSWYGNTGGTDARYLFDRGWALDGLD